MALMFSSMKSAPFKLPEGEPLFPQEVLTDRPERFLVSELVREQMFLATQKEIPYAVAVTIDGWQERIADLAAKTGRADRRSDRRHDSCRKPGQKKILVGERGQMIRNIGTLARQQIGNFGLRRKNLQLFVRVDEDWSQTPSGLRRWAMKWRRGDEIGTSSGCGPLFARRWRLSVVPMLASPRCSILDRQPPRHRRRTCRV